VYCTCTVPPCASHYAGRWTRKYRTFGTLSNSYKVTNILFSLRILVCMFADCIFAVSEDCLSDGENGLTMIEASALWVGGTSVG
jgi:hypothetical protein